MESCISYPVANCLHTKLILLPHPSWKPSFYRHINSLSFQTMEQSWNFSIPEFYPPMVSPLFLPRCISTAIQRLKFPNEGSCTLKAAQSKAIRVLGTKHSLSSGGMTLVNTSGPCGMNAIHSQHCRAIQNRNPTLPQPSRTFQTEGSIENPLKAQKLSETCKLSKLSETFQCPEAPKSFPSRTCYAQTSETCRKLSSGTFRYVPNHSRSLP